MVEWSESKLRQVALVRNLPRTQRILYAVLLPQPYLQYKHICVVGEMSEEGAWLAEGLGCQWTHIHGGHVDILSVMNKSVQLGGGLTGPSPLRWLCCVQIPRC